MKRRALLEEAEDCRAIRCSTRHRRSSSSLLARKCVSIERAITAGTNEVLPDDPTARAENDETRTDIPSLADAGALLAQELSQLSLEERERVFEDIHGVPQLIEEEPVFVDACLERMEAELCRIPSKPAYERALFLAPRRVKDRKFRLMFLRAEKFDTAKAATRLVNYFDYKLELFGIDRLVKDITYDDLDEDDLATMMTGHMQFVPGNGDQAGRTILFANQTQVKYRNFRNQV